MARKIIGGKEIPEDVNYLVKQKILWPCYEFKADVMGLFDGDSRDVLEDTILKFAGIGFTDSEKISKLMGIDEDLVVFVQSKLQQKDYLDTLLRVTNEGANSLSENNDNDTPDTINVYVDALSGGILPFYTKLDEDYYFKCSELKFRERNHQSDKWFHYKNLSSTGTESDSVERAYSLDPLEKFNNPPNKDEVLAMLLTLHPEHPSISVLVDNEQLKERNLNYVLIDVMLIDGDTRNWVFSDGLGRLSPSFCMDYINDTDSGVIQSLRSNLNSGVTSNNDENSIEDSSYPLLSQKIVAVQKNMDVLMETVTSSDKAEEHFSAKNKAILALYQLLEWALHYLLHQETYKKKIENVLTSLIPLKKKADSYIDVGILAEECAKSLNQEINRNVRNCLQERASTLISAFTRNTPKLFPLLDLMLLGLADEPKLKEFLGRNTDFLKQVVELHNWRNKSLHAGHNEIEDNYLKQLRDLVFDFLYPALGVSCDKDHVMTFDEKTRFRTARTSAIERMEKGLGPVVCREINWILKNFVTDMEQDLPNKTNVDNAIVIDIYRILESIFTSVNNTFNRAWLDKDWIRKAIYCNFYVDEKNKSEFGAVVHTKPENIDNAIDRKKSSMNAECIAFISLSNDKLLRDTSAIWRNMIKDVNYIAIMRGHGEIPDKIDVDYVMSIKTQVYKFITLLTKKGYLR